MSWSLHVDLLLSKLSNRKPQQQAADVILLYVRLNIQFNCDLSQIRSVLQQGDDTVVSEPCIFNVQVGFINL